ncbi:hypothetical protein D3C86_1849190 [compost metagenome]
MELPNIRNTRPSVGSILINRRQSHGFLFLFADSWQFVGSVAVGQEYIVDISEVVRALLRFAVKLHKDI